MFMTKTQINKAAQAVRIATDADLKVYGVFPTDDVCEWVVSADRSFFMVDVINYEYREVTDNEFDRYCC